MSDESVQTDDDLIYNYAWTSNLLIINSLL